MARNGSSIYTRPAPQHDSHIATDLSSLEEGSGTAAPAGGTQSMFHCGGPARGWDSAQPHSRLRRPGRCDLGCSRSPVRYLQHNALACPRTGASWSSIWPTVTSSCCKRPMMSFAEHQCSSFHCDAWSGIYAAHSWPRADSVARSHSAFRQPRFLRGSMRPRREASCERSRCPRRGGTVHGLSSGGDCPRLRLRRCPRPGGVRRGRLRSQRSLKRLRHIGRPRSPLCQGEEAKRSNWSARIGRSVHLSCS